MGNQGSTGITWILLLTILLLVSSSIIYGLASSGDEDDQDVEDLLESALKEIESYFVVKEGYAKMKDEYLMMVLLIKPVFSTPIPLSNLTLEVNDGKVLRLLNLSGVFDSKDVFNEDFWSDLNQSFAIVPVIDKDGSLREGFINGDLFYVAFKISKDAERIEVSIISGYGSVSEVEIILPFSTSDVFKIY